MAGRPARGALPLFVLMLAGRVVQLFLRTRGGQALWLFATGAVPSLSLLVTTQVFGDAPP